VRNRPSPAGLATEAVTAAGAAALGSLGAGACAPEASDPSSGPASAPPLLPRETLRALADVALPTQALGAEGTETAVRGFAAWVEGFQAAAELDHPYLTGELRYGPPHPGPRWAAQLEAMDLESERRSGVRFDPDQAKIHVGDVQICDAGMGLGSEAEARATAIMRTESYSITLTLGDGAHAFTYTTSDLGHGYVDVNAGYRS